MFWNGPITDFQVASAKSFIYHGFDVWMWTYRGYDLTTRIVQKDASEILDESVFSDKIFLPRMELKENARREALYTAQSDILRFLILKQYGGWWSDCDVICLKDVSYFDSLSSTRKICVGLVDEHLANTAVMSFQDYLILNKIIEENEITFNSFSVFEFGQLNLGPVNKVIKDFGIENQLLPRKIFYPHTGNTSDFWSGKSDIKLKRESYMSLTMHWENSFDHVKDRSGYLEDLKQKYLTMPL